jgi:outer membrane protein
MLLLRLKSIARLAGLLLLAGAVSLASGQDSQGQAAQQASPPPEGPKPVQTSQPQQFIVKDYSKPTRAFPNVIAPYMPQHVPPPNLANASRIDQLLQDGKIMLSMDDAIALALENNLDIGIARYNLNIADTEVLRSKGGANNFLGVNTGIVQNTPGGDVGGLGGTVGAGPGGTAPGQGGIGAGTNGLVSSTLGIGSLITSYDPVITGTGQEDHASILPTSIFTGAPPGSTLAQNTGTYNAAYNQGFSWGTNLSVGFNNTRITTNSLLNNYSPLINTGFQARVTQHLLQGFGFLPNTRLIRITKNNREISDVAFRLQITTTVDQMENLYWNLVYAYENVKVQEEALTFAQKTLSDTQKQVKIGSLAPIEEVRALNTVATDQQGLTQAQTNLDLQQLLMKNALSRNLQDPVLADAEVIPTSTMQLPEQEAVIPTEELVNDALSHRAELAESRIDLSNREISSKALRNALLPTVDVFAYYGGTGIGGSQNPNNVCSNPNSIKGFCSDGSTTAPFVPTTSYTSALNDLINSAGPDKGVGVTVTIPLRNRQAQALQVRSELEYRQAQMLLQQIENRVRIEVRNAQFSLRQNRASVQAAQAAVRLARQSLDAEQKKLNLGASTSTLVLQNQSGLATAESNLVSAMANYEKSHVELDRATGLLLDHLGIVMSDAETGQVTHMPHVPFVTARPNPQSVLNPVQPASTDPLAQPPQPQQQPQP